MLPLRHIDWGLRDYGTEPIIWDGKEDCEHNFPNDMIRKLRTKPGINASCGNTLREVAGRTINNGNFCQPCGAWKGNLGLEPTPELYVQHLVQIFREVKRVLRSRGTIWLNIGDSYWGGKGQSGQQTQEYQSQRVLERKSFNRVQIGGPGLLMPKDGKHSTIKPKDLCMIPARVALALQADSWYLRQDIVWSKPNPMPESVKDRCTKSHEYIFLLTKSAKYFYDYDAILEPYTEPLNRCGGDSLKKETIKHSKYLDMQNISQSSTLRVGRNMRPNEEGKNKRSVWNIPTAPFPEAHFAVFPEKIPEICIKAGCPKDGIVLDPFSGSGTTGLVAKKLNRKCILIDLKKEYCEMTIKRVSQQVLDLK